METRKIRVIRSRKASQVISRRQFLKAGTGALLLGALGMPTVAFGGTGKLPHQLKRRVKASDRKASAKNLQAAGAYNTTATLVASATGVLTPDYFGATPNWALSPILAKFKDSLPGLGPTGANNLGNYIPLAAPDTAKYPGADYYEIELGEYTHQFHSDLPATKLRGYRQTNNGGTPFGYLGPVIVAQKDRPVRIKFTNKLPTGAGGNLFIPVDETVMGAGMGPNGGTETYTQNRATLHLHGGNTMWISDGTAHQWTTPAGETTSYPKGVSVQNVPDMPAAGDGELTFYYSNQQSARLLFYHDHAYGITRLNVYAGEAAGYLLTDPAEDALLAGAVPADQLPLIIQDKTFVDDTTIGTLDPTWNWGTAALDPVTHIRPPVKGDLWFPHVYMPNQNPWDMSGANAMGRWDYGPWFWPPFTGITNSTVPNPYYDPANASWEPPEIPGTPNPSIVPEAFMDTPIVNGAAYPYVNVQPKAYRLRILNACNDRFLNLQLWQADPSVTTSDGRNNTEVKMVPAVPGTWPAGWPTPDGRDGGWPDPSTAGPAMIQIGTEAGLLPAPVVIQNRPIGYDYDRRSVTVLNVLETAIFLGPAERADVVVDFSQFAGKTIILYNDAPTPVPAFDSRVDYYTGAPDQTANGGAPTPQAGFGPNTRTIMQINVASATPTAAFDLAALQAALPAAYVVGHPAPIVPQAGANNAYNLAFGTSFPADGFARIFNTSMTLPSGAVGTLTITNGGGGYTSAPTVAISAPATAGGIPATATAVLAPTSVASLALTSGGSGYTSAPTVALTGGGGTGATATAALAATGSVKSIAVTAQGSGYSSVPTVSIAAPPAGGTQATATATVTNRRVTAITVTNGGSGYASAPIITITGGGGTGAAATATLGKAVASLTLTAGGSNYTSAPTVSFTGGAGTGAAATAVLGPRVVASLTLTKAGSGYLAAPTVTIAPPAAGTQATATASLATVSMPLRPKAIQELFDPDYGRMNAILGVEIPNTTGMNQTTIPYYFADPPTEIFKKLDGVQALGSAADGTQLWKITHNGVDTHAIHFHLFDVQLINRVGWDGMIKPPDANELGWKDTIRMNPLEDIVVAMRPTAQTLPTGWLPLPNSIRRLDVTMPIGSVAGFTNVDPIGQPATVTNQLVNFGNEYTWHCHLLGHEENDMMRPTILAVPPLAPTVLTAVAGRSSITLSWKTASLNYTGFTVQRATNANGPWTNVKTVNNILGAALPVVGTAITTTDTTVAKKTAYIYRVIANNVVGYTQTYAAPAVGYPTMSADSAPSNQVNVTSL